MENISKIKTQKVFLYYTKDTNVGKIGTNEDIKGRQNVKTSRKRDKYIHTKWIQNGKIQDT